MPPEPGIQVAFLTGQSNPDSCRLSPVQAQFLQQLRQPGRVMCALNFPYRNGMAAHTNKSLLAASYANTRQYLLSRHLAFVEQYQRDVLALLAHATHTVFLAGSCGLELLINLHLSDAELAKISVFAYGPVARRRPACHHWLVHGTRDWLSRWFFSDVDQRVACGHMDYLLQPSVLAGCQEFLSETERRLRPKTPKSSD